MQASLRRRFLRARQRLSRCPRRLPDLPISLSCEVSPVIGEYERSSTTLANAYVQPLMGAYLGRMRESLAAIGLAAPILVMTSEGGLASVETASRFPVRLPKHEGGGKDA